MNRDDHQTCTLAREPATGPKFALDSHPKGSILSHQELRDEVLRQLG